MLVPLFAVAVGLVSIGLGAALLRSPEAVSRLWADFLGRFPSDVEPSGDTAFRDEAVDAPDSLLGEERAVPIPPQTSRRSLERGFTLVILGLLCVLFGVVGL